MTPTGQEDPEQRRLRNLQAIARHHAAGGSAAAPEPGERAGERAGGAVAAWKKRLAAFGPLGLIVIFVLGKFKLIVPFLKFMKVGTLLTMILSVWAYALIWGLPFAAGFVLLIFVHEMGHAVVMRQQGIRAGAPVFIPFVGAVIAMKSLPRNAWVEALVGIGGPVLGTAGALVCLIIAALTGSPFWYALAWVGFMINLFNMIPISPLDGGRIVGVISRWIWLAGYAVGAGVFFVTRSPILFLILLLGLFNLGSTLRGPRPGYFEIPAGKRVSMGVAYFGLLALLALGMWIAGQPLENLDPEVEPPGLASLDAVRPLLR